MFGRLVVWVLPHARLPEGMVTAYETCPRACAHRCHNRKYCFARNLLCNLLCNFATPQIWLRRRTEAEKFAMKDLLYNLLPPSKSDNLRRSRYLPKLDGHNPGFKTEVGTP